MYISQKFLLIVGMVLLLLPLASAFGVTTPYWDSKPLTLHPGETRDVTLTLQNMVGGKDITLRGEIEDGIELAKFLDESRIYKVPFESKDVPVRLRIHIPESTPLGPTKVSISLNQLTESEGKMVQFGAGVRTDIPLVIESNTLSKVSSAATFGEILSSITGSNIVLMLALLGVVVFVIVLALFMRR